MLRNFFNRAVKEPLMALKNSNFVAAFKSLITPRQTPELALATVRANPQGNNNAFRRRPR